MVELLTFMGTHYFLAFTLICMTCWMVVCIFALVFQTIQVFFKSLAGCCDCHQKRADVEEDEDE